MVVPTRVDVWAHRRPRVQPYWVTTVNDGSLLPVFLATNGPCLGVAPAADLSSCGGVWVWRCKHQAVCRMQIRCQMLLHRCGSEVAGDMRQCLPPGE